MKNIERLFFPLIVFASVLSVYFVFKKSTGTEQGAIVPNPAGAGVTAVQTQGGAVQPQNFTVPPLATNPARPILLANPTNPTPGQNLPVPSYLAFNFGPGLALNKSTLPPVEKTPGDMGACCDPCGGATGEYNFSDGGKDKLVATRARQLRGSSPSIWLGYAAANVESYYAATATEFGAI